MAKEVENARTGVPPFHVEPVKPERAGDVVLVVRCRCRDQKTRMNERRVDSDGRLGATRRRSEVGRLVANRQRVG